MVKRKLQIMINEDIKEYNKYFTPKSRDKYYVMMKVEACRRLKANTEFSLSKIAQIVFKDKKRHDTVIHYLKHYKEPIDYTDFIKTKFDELIESKKYPMSIHFFTQRKPLHGAEMINKQGYVREAYTDFKEVDLEEFVNKI